MRKVDGTLRLSASDLMRFKGCRHATTLDLRMLETGDISPCSDGAEAELLQKQGDAHELSFLDGLRSSGRHVVEIPKVGLPLETSVRLTNEALAAGPDVVFQGAFAGGAWGGYSDFLERVESPSSLGEWSYEVVDTKLKRKPDPKHVLQLCLYSDLLAEAQGFAPEAAHLQLGDGNRYTVRLADVSAYARHARRVFERFLAERPVTHPEPVPACTMCRWRERCRAGWEADDSLSLVAGISRSQRRKLEGVGVATMAALATHEGRVPRMARETLDRLGVQARLQTARRAGGPPSFELREPENGKGFDLLPEPDDGDVFYDIEGDPYYPGGLEYLHGLWLREGGEWAFRAFWAHDRDAEGRAVAELLSFLVDHLRRHPRAHVYHYANYEIAALRRLTAHHRTGEAAMDQLQRERRFVDLFKVVAGGMIASEKGYSIKDLEAFYMEKRDGDVATAGASVVFYEKWRETTDPTLLDRIHDYNRTDCVSTQLLRDWLVADVKPPGGPWRDAAPMPEAGSLSNVEEEDATLETLGARLEPVRARLGDRAANVLLDLSGFYRREDKPTYWGIFDRLAQESADLVDDLECVALCEAVAPATKVTAQSWERVYSFPAQETKVRAGASPSLKPATGIEEASLRAIDREAGILTLRRSARKGLLPDRLDLLPASPINKKALREAVSAVTEAIIADRGEVAAAEHLLARTLPVFLDGPRARIVSEDGDLPAATSLAIGAMADTTLAIQGPPGTGKTYVSALAIVDLVRSGRRVAVSSNSHKAIGNLLAAVADRARVEGTSCRIVQKTSGDGDEPHLGVTLVADNDAPEIATADVVGATAWHFARYDAPAFSHLFIDEAGQVALANVLAMARAARNLVLVGDPMQLPQPLQGTHPGDSGRSCLEYLVDGERVVAPERGVFMPVSRRMHPDVCRFVSTIAYEGRLSSDPMTAVQRLLATDGSEPIGASMHAINHLERSQTCPEEIEAILREIRRLDGATFRDRNGVERTLGHEDILVVAPYNAQVNALRTALPPRVRVGTVDRFQGQEAPVCLVSMTTSSGEEMPRDIAFLFSLNRINVAISRAQVLATAFANPMLLETPCRTVEEMALVNALCLLSERRRPFSAPA